MMRTSPLLAAAALALALGAPGAAHAQGIPGGPTRNYSPPTKLRPEDMPQPAPPPALPGASSQFQPAERTTGDLPPTEALFDAINRGDIAAARDAINRGADLTGHNILGMTPLELSVDLSHNDITFLLLSLRGGGGTARPAATATATTKAGAAPPKAPAAAPAPRLAAQAPRPAPVPVPAPAVRQFAGPGDTGTPNPAAGFLGFGGTAR